MPPSPTALQRILIRQGLDYRRAALAIRRGHDGTLRLTPGYLGKIAAGRAPSLRLGRAIVHWARRRGEVLDLGDLGIEVD